MAQNCYEIHCKGLVQGVGFRPFVYKLARQFGLFGEVENRNDGVIIKVLANNATLDLFVAKLKSTTPIAYSIYSIFVKEIAYLNFSDFSIVKSKNHSDEITEISPDIAVCDECLQDIKIQQHRINYPFTNCTHCGPRFTIIKDLPYDRAHTTMSPFAFCPKCASEYADILDRRFHAQPVACNYCGPKYELILPNRIVTDFAEILNVCVNLIDNCKIITLKGLGGFHLSCDAFNNEAVTQLRNIKLREGKPFAVLFKNLQSIESIAFTSQKEAESLQSWQCPIVLLKLKSETTLNTISQAVSNGVNQIGAMLPYLPFHYLLFEKLKTTAIVLTSGNFSDEPIVISNELALKQFTPKTDAVLTYNREIFNRTDDSVGMVVNQEFMLFRRSRGYAPSPIRLNFKVEGVVAMGAELVNCFCVGKDNQAILSQHIGDLKNWETYQFYTETLQKFIKLFRVKPVVLAVDLHPEYLSTKFAYQLQQEYQEKGQRIDIVPIQHHHAHIAACMAEHVVDEQVIGVSFDGIGYGTDGNSWGGEFLVCDFNDFERVSHFDYLPIPGGDAASQNPWRMAVSYLYDCFGRAFLDFDLPMLKAVNRSEILIVVQAIEKKLNCPLTSSAGRLFDAIAALTGLCLKSTFHAEAPMRLESAIEPNITGFYPFEICETISFKPTIRAVVDDLLHQKTASIISAKFHNTIIQVILEMTRKISETYGIKKVVLSGGVFQNKYLIENILKEFKTQKISVYISKLVPPNDGGIAVGQLAIAAKRMKNYANCS